MSASPASRTALRLRRRLLFVYAALLVLSHLTTCHQAGKPWIEPAFTGDEEVLVLLDPLPPGAVHLRPLLEDPPENAPVIRMLDVPGINRPVSSPPPFQKLAETIVLPEQPVTLLANGNSGPVAMHLAALYPERVNGLILLDIHGVLEFTLLGEHHLNQVLYSVSHAVLRGIQVAVPHFGYWERLPLRRSQLQVLRHSDRRLLRPLTEQISQPVLLLEPDLSLRKELAAREHTRILPQSRSLVLDQSPGLAELAGGFVEDIRSGAAPLREDAVPERVEEAAREFDPAERPALTGRALVLTLLVIGIATLFTEDGTAAVTGLMIANDSLTWIQGVAACLTGILLLDYLLFLAGKVWGRPALQRVPLRWMIDPGTMRETEEWFSRHAEKSILISRFVPGTRLPAYVAAGILGMSAKRFAFWFVISTLVWTPLFVTLSWQLSEQALEWVNRYHHAAPALVLAGLALYALVTHVLVPCCNWRGRRKLLGRWRRFIRPQYWPAFMYYVPVGVYLLGRSLRRGRHLMDFTACNPGIPAGGFAGESKSDILNRIGLRDTVAATLTLPGNLSERKLRERLPEWMKLQGISFPACLKPDIGERGDRVCRVESVEEVIRHIQASPRQDWVMQAQQSGCEFGIFYMRDPREEKGFLFGITRKEFPELVGDGQRNLGDLILADERAMCQAPVHFLELGEQVSTVPEAGKRFRLTWRGNHSRGTRFLEGNDLITPALTRRMDEIAKSIPGFYFGRFDLFAPDEDCLRKGKQLVIIELNGLTSEATNLYDSRYHYREMVWILLKQWQWACHIGSINREQGFPLESLPELLRGYDRSRKLQTSLRSSR